MLNHHLPFQYCCVPRFRFSRSLLHRFGFAESFSPQNNRPRLFHISRPMRHQCITHDHDRRHACIVLISPLSWIDSITNVVNLLTYKLTSPKLALAMWPDPTSCLSPTAVLPCLSTFRTCVMSHQLYCIHPNLNSESQTRTPSCFSFLPHLRHNCQLHIASSSSSSSCAHTVIKKEKQPLWSFGLPLEESNALPLLTTPSNTTSTLSSFFCWRKHFHNPTCTVHTLHFRRLHVPEYYETSFSPVGCAPGNAPVALLNVADAAFPRMHVAKYLCYIVCKHQKTQILHYFQPRNSLRLNSLTMPNHTSAPISITPCTS